MMNRKLTDEKILSYNDVVLRRSDLEILSGNHFINDRLIEFYFSYLATNSIKDVELVPPAIAYWITNCPDCESLQNFLEPLKLTEKRLVLFPVNDNVDVTLAEGGFHWSLLVYFRQTNTFVHHDSNGKTNNRCARKLALAVAPFVNPSSSEVEYLEFNGYPQQINGYDCGLYVALTARVICNWSQKGGDEFWGKDVKELVTSSNVAKLRIDILQLIQDLVVSN